MALVKVEKSALPFPLRCWKRKLFAVVGVGLGLFGGSNAYAGTNYVWNQPAGGAWNTTSQNWLVGGTASTYGSVAGNSATFGNVIDAASAISIASGGITVGAINFTDVGTFTYTVGTASNGLTLDNAGVAAQINVGHGSDALSTISNSAITLPIGLSITNNGAIGVNTLTISSAINGSATGASITYTGQGNTTIGGAIGANVTGGLTLNGTGTLALTVANTFTGGITVNSGVISISVAGALNATNGNTITLGSASSTAVGVYRTTAAVTSTASENFTIAGNGDLDVSSGITSIINGIISGPSASSLAVTTTGGTGVGQYTMHGVNTFAGAFSIGGPGQIIGSAISQPIVGPTNGATVFLNTTGYLATPSSITINNGAALTLTQAASAGGDIGRIGTLGAAPPLFFNGGRFQYNTNVSNTSALIENFGAVTVTGLAVISGSSTAAGAGTTTSITFAGISGVTAPSLDLGTIFFRSTATGAGIIGGTPGLDTVNYFFTGLTASSGTAGTPTQGIIPWAANVTTLAGSNAANLMTYDANGMRPLSSSEVVATTSSLTAGQNNSLGGSSFANSGTIAINSLINSPTTATTSTITGTGIITVNGGGTIGGAVTGSSPIIFNGPTVDFGAGTGYLHLGALFTFSGTSNITGSAGVVVSALGTTATDAVVFANTTASPFTGGLFINGSAQVYFNADNQLGTTGSGNGVTLGGGQLLYNGTSSTSLDPNRGIRVGAAGGTIGSTVAGVTLTIPGTISGPGQIQFGGGIISLATGVVALTNSSGNTYTGGTLISAGILNITNPNQLGTGSIFLSGGTLQAGGNLTFGVSPAAVPTLVTSSTIDTQANSIALNGGLNGVGTSTTLTKVGSGTLTVSGAGNYAGSIAVNAGALTINGNGALNELGPLTLGLSTTLNIDNSGTNLTGRTGRGTNLTLSNGGTAAGGATVNLTTNSAGSTFEFGSLTASGGTATAVNTSILNILDGGSGFNSITFVSLAASANNLLNINGTVNLGTPSTTSGSHIFFQTTPSSTALSYVTMTGYGNGGVLTTTEPIYSTTLGLILPQPTIGSVIDNINSNGTGSPTPTTAVFSTNAPTTANLGATISSLTMNQLVTLHTGVNAPSTTGGANGLGNGNAPSNTLVLTSGSLTSTASSTITSSTAAVVQFGSTGTTNASITLAGGDLTFDTQVTPTTTGGLTTGGTGNLFINGPNAITGLYTIGNTANVTLNTATTAGGLTGSAGNLVVNAPLTINGTTSNTYSGTISGSSTISTPAAFTGTQTLSGNNTYTGTITVNGGTLAAANAAAFGTTSASVIVNSGGTVTLTGGITLNSISMTLNGTGATGSAGALDNLSGTNTYNGNISLGSATQIGATAGTLNLGGNITTNSGGLTFNPTGTINSSGVIGGTGNVIMSGSGTLTVSGSSNYSGSTSLYTGTIKLLANNALPATTSLIIGTTAGSSGMTLNLNGFTQAVSGITIYAMAVETTVITIGTGQLTLNGNLSLVNNTGAPGLGYQAIISSTAGGALDLGGQVRNIVVAGQDNGGSDLFFNALVQNGGINFTGNPSTAGGATGLSLEGSFVNTYTGGTTVNAGTLTVVAAATLGPGSVLINQTGTVVSSLALKQNDTITSLATGTVATVADAKLTLTATLTIDQSTNTTFVGIISGAGAIVMNGPGILSLTGANTFTGGVTIANGTIAVTTLAAPGTASGLGEAASTVSFTLGGTGTTGLLAYNGTTAFNYARNFIIATGGSGGFAGSGALTVSSAISGSGNLVYSGTGSTALTAANTFSGNISVTSGLLTFSGTTGTANSSGNVSISGGGQLTLDNTLGAIQRLNTAIPANLTLNNGQLTIIGNPTTNLSGNTELLGTLSVTAGNNTTNFLTLSNASSTTPLQIQFSSLSISSGASLLIRGDSLGSSTASNYTRVLFTTAPASPGNPITGVYFDSSSTGTGLGQAAYDPTLGIILYASPISTNNVLDNINSPMIPTTNSFITGGSGTTLTVNAGATINDIKIQNEFTTVNFSNLYSPQSGNANAPAGTLVVTSGLFQVLNTAANVTVNGAAGGSTLQTASGWTFNLNTNLTFASSMTVVGAGLNITGTGNLTINGTNSITGNYTLGAGNLTISGATTASAITVNGASILSIGGTTTAASLTLNGTTAGATFLGNAAFTGAITSSGTANTLTLGGTTSAASLTLGGTATATLSGAATISGAVTLSGTGNTLTLTAGGTAGNLVGVTGNSLTLGGNLTLNGTTASTYAGTISGTNGSITKTNTGTLTLSGTNTFGGGLTVNAGTVAVSVGAAVGTGVLTLSGGTLSYTGGTDMLTASSISLGSANGTVGVTTAGTVLTLNTTISGTGSLSFTGTGTLNFNLSSQATYTGSTTMAKGILTLSGNNQLPNTTALSIGAATADTTAQFNMGSFNQTIGSLTLLARGSGAVTSVIGTGTLQVNGSISYVNGTTDAGDEFTGAIAPGILDLGGAICNITVAGQNNGTTPGDLSLNTIIQDGGINFTGNPSTDGAGPTGITLGGTGTNTYALGTTVNAGTLNVAATTTLGSGGLVINQSGTVLSAVIVNSSMTIASLATGTIAVSADASLSIATGSILTLNQSNNALTLPVNTTFAGVISGAGGIALTASPTASGAGTLTLTGVNTYTGTTTVNAGTLLVNGSLAAGSAVTVSGGTLGGTGTVNGTVTVNSGTLMAGNANGVGTLKIVGATTISAGATIGVAISNGSTPSSTPGGSTIGTLPNPTSNNFLSISSSSSSINAGALITINGTGTTFSGPNYSYEIGKVTGLDLSILSITTQSQFTAIGFTASNFSLTGDSSGDIFLNFTTPVPESSTVLLIGSAAGLCVYIRQRRRRQSLADWVAAFSLKILSSH